MADTTPPASPEVPEPAVAATEAPAAAPAASIPPVQPQYAQQPYVPGPKTNTLAIVSLILSILWISIAGAIIGHVALKQIKQRGEAGHGLALAGVIIGWIGVAGWIAVWIFTIIWVLVLGGSLWGLSTMGDYDYNY